MNRLTKVLYFGFLLVVAIANLVAGDILFGIGMALLIILAMHAFEYRESKRQFYRALRKLYSCVDIKAYLKEVEKLKRNALVKRYYVIPIKVLNALEFYYLGNRDAALSVLNSVDLKGDYAFWKACYLGLIDRTAIDLALIESTYVSVPRAFKEIASQRFKVMSLLSSLTIKSDEPEAMREQVEALREQVNVNLLIAELTKCLRDLSDNERLRNYYNTGVINLSKGLIV